MVAPAPNLIFVVTGKSRGAAQFTAAKMFNDYVLTAIGADGPLEEDADASTALAALANPPSPTEIRSAIPILSEIARTVSGLTFTVENNPYKTDNLQFVFNDGQPYAEFGYTAREKWTPRYRIGLDDVAHLTRNHDGAYVARGQWTSDDTFELEVEIVGYTTFDRWEFRFLEDGVVITEHSITGKYTYRGRTLAD